MWVDVNASNTWTTAAPLTTTTMRPSTRYEPTQASPYDIPPYHNIGVLKPPRPTVSLDPRPVLIPILSSVICFPIVAFAVICLLRYRALRLRKREHQRRLRGGMRSARLEIPGREKPSLFSRDSSSGDTTSRPPGQEEESGRRARLASSSSDEDEDFASDVLARRSSNNHVKFGAAAAILHVPGIPSPRSTSPRRASSSRRSSSPRSAGSPRSPSVSFLDVVGVVGDSDDDADDEDDLEHVDDR